EVRMRGHKAVVAGIPKTTDNDILVENGSAADENKKSEQMVICRRCKESYKPSLNNSSACRFHPSLFVCRRHDDQKRYYELGPDDPPYAAKFYDCCGAEEPEAPGCTTNFHISYDDA
nr:hypothetical protein [Tanacetum cinerariifolium]